ncbi:uncharacterized protein ARMOST_05693 [Armillaria ostoyae]|uniref:Uncharacterized protein n=1 Tax=Armillaria ostoyae TaxID=47428 RepID=A0A284R0W7_ARMOS|nr:uncharacterized protein ARMOST_05693 [Armillaria ostoyae]
MTDQALTVSVSSNSEIASGSSFVDLLLKGRLTKYQSHNLLFTTERLLPAVDSPTPETLEERRKAQAAFVAYLQKEGKAGPLLVARFVARQIAFEMLKLMPGYPGKPDEQHFTNSEGEGYMLADHMERLRYIVLAEVRMTRFVHFLWLMVDDGHLFMASLQLPSVQKMWKRPRHHMQPLTKLGLPSTF